MDHVQSSLQHDSGDDDYQLLKIFPEELWLLVMLKLNDGKAYEKTFHASLFFRSTLLSKRSIYLFPCVFQVFAQWVHYKQSQSISTGSDQTQKWYKDILSLRLVCKFWNQAIKNFYQNTDNLSNYVKEKGESAIHKYKNTFSWTKDVFCVNQGIESSSLENFLNHFETTHGLQKSPFLSENVTIKYQHKFLSPQLQYQEHSLFKKFKTLNLGKTVQTLKLVIYSHIPISSKNVETINRILELVPNVKKVKISIVSWISLRQSEAQFTGVKGQLEAKLREKCFSVLPNLESMVIDNVPIQIVNAFLKRNPQIKTLKIFNCHEIMEKLDFALERDLTMLKHAPSKHMYELHYSSPTSNWKRHAELVARYSGAVNV